MLQDVIWSYTGFEDLRKYCRSMTEFCRDVASIVHDRSKLEATYADGLLKLANRAKKSTGDSLGTVRTAWDSFATKAEEESEIHKHLSVELLDQVVKPIKSFVESQKEARKQVEASVDKANKQLNEKRTEEVKIKKHSFRCSKDAEALTVQVEGMRDKTTTPKELAKLDSKCKKAEEGVFKADKDRIKKLVEAERARLNLDASLANCCSVVETLEKERVGHLQRMLRLYCELLEETTPKLNQCYSDVLSVVSAVDAANDISCLVETRGSTRQPADQVIFDCFEADMTNSMDNHRRRVALEAKLQELSKTFKSEKRARAGLSKLSSVYNETPGFSDNTNKNDVSVQLAHANGVIDCLDASCFNVARSLASLDRIEPPQNNLASYISETKDKMGIPTTVLRIPVEQVYQELVRANDDDDIDEQDYSYGGYGGHVQDIDDDDFDDVGFEEEASSEYSMLSRCRACYEYIAARDDELTITENDVITITSKLDDGWWEGELRGRVGIFPASYVEEL